MLAEYPGMETYRDLFYQTDWALWFISSVIALALISLAIYLYCKRKVITDRIGIFFLTLWD